MAAREEIVKTLAAVFAVQIQKWDGQHYPYQQTEAMYEDHLQAAESINDNDKRSIVLRRLDVLSSGRIVWNNVKTVWEAGVWVSPEHDPRAADPKFREYLRLKEIYENE